MLCLLFSFNVFVLVSLQDFKYNVRLLRCPMSPDLQRLTPVRRRFSARLQIVLILLELARFFITHALRRANLIAT